MGHETLEGYYESRGEDPNSSHNHANEHFPGFNQAPTWDTARALGNMVIGIVGNTKIAGTNITERITVDFDTPVPKADFMKKKGAPYKSYPDKSYPVDVERKP